MEPTETDARWQVASNVMTTHRGHLRDEGYCLLPDRSVLNVELEKTRRQLCAARVEIETVSKQVTAQKWLKEEAQRIMKDVQYEWDGEKALITQLEDRDVRVQERVDHNLGCADRLETGTYGTRDQFVETLLLDL